MVKISTIFVENIKMSSQRSTRPINNPGKRKPIKFETEAKPNRFKMSMNPDPVMVKHLARYLLPITPEEVMTREYGESAIIKAYQTTLCFGCLGFLIGSGSYAYEVLPKKDAIFSFKAMSKQGLKTGASLGFQVGVTDLIETSLSYRRGKTRFYDRIIAGTVAGAVCNIPSGKEAIKKGAINGALLSTAMTAINLMQEWVM